MRRLDNDRKKLDRGKTYRSVETIPYSCMAERLCSQIKGFNSVIKVRLWNNVGNLAKALKSYDNELTAYICIITLIYLSSELMVSHSNLCLQSSSKIY